MSPRGGLRPVAVATSAGVGDLDEDQPLLEEALARRGVVTDRHRWDDPDVDWSRYALVVVRSTWDYHERRAEFLAWTRAVEHVTRLENPAPVIEWTTDKRYLRSLESAGVPVVETTWLEPGSPVRLPPGEIVVKPAVSAGSRNTARFTRGAVSAAEGLVRRLLDDGHTVMVQPYVTAVDHTGETGLVYVDGRFHHAFRKGPLLAPDAAPTADLFAREQIDPVDATADELAVGRSALALAPGDTPLLYGRVDLAPGRDGTPLVLEVELAEPSLFFAACGHRADELARAIAARC